MNMIRTNTEITDTHMFAAWDWYRTKIREFRVKIMNRGRERYLSPVPLKRAWIFYISQSRFLKTSIGQVK